MGSYVNNILASGEAVVYETRLHWKIFIWPVLFIPLYGIGLVWLLINFITWLTSEFVVTDRRVVIKTGFISRKAFDVSLDKVESIFIEQGVIDRLIGCGTVAVQGTGSSSQPSRSVANPFIFKRMIEEAAEARRTK